MAEIQHTLQETINLAVKLAVQKVKLDLYPIGKTWLTFGDENPADIVGGEVGEGKIILPPVFR